MSTAKPLKWHGGKHYLSDWIISKFATHTHYVEPYFGGGSVLFAKDPEGISEVVNDINLGLSNFYWVLQTPELFQRFMQVIELTPFSEDEFSLATENTPTVIEYPVKSAVDFFIRYRMSRQGLGKDFATLSRNRTRRGMNEQVAAWLSTIEGLPEAHERLKRVVVLNRDAIDVIKQQDGPNTLFYLDPPYLHETRVTTSDYEFEMTYDKHAKLLLTLEGIKGKFVLSGYPSELYASFAKKNKWNYEERLIDNKASSKKTKETKVECLWWN